MGMKKLNIAFIWHFHQPSYQSKYDSDFLLPWVRLHASKDYLDMLKRIDKFKNIKLNFNFSPVLLASLQKYAQGAKDLHLKLLIKNENELTPKDKIFILNNYFDLNYKNMVLPRPYFTDLYNRRAQAQDLDLDMFNLQEYCDIMANFTLCWIDKSFCHDYSNLAYLFQKEKNYTLDERKEIYEIQLDIIKRILVEYKKYQDLNKIEVSISPYYHPILPLLLDFKNKEIKDFENLPQNFSRVQDAKTQIELGIKKYIEIFDKKPNGMWLSEQCVCQKSIDLLSKMGLKWTVLDEGILSKTIKNEFIRDFEGNLENPFNLNINYKTKSKHSLNLIFADSFFSNLINFGYGSYDSISAANDIYEKIKIIQSKLQNSPKENHILTIAMDGENCWETYQNDGTTFLEAFYKLIDEDESLRTVLVGDFVNNNSPEIIENLKSGSWINRNFDLWIGEPTKNVAWLYLSSVCADFDKYSKQLINSIKTPEDKKICSIKIKNAKQELLIAQGSDWYWWYGKPNESRNDGVFDYLFRSHLMNVYEILGFEIPQYLTMPLSDASIRALRNPIGQISPSLSCDIDDENNEWVNAGCIFVPDGPTSNITRLIKNILFGFDKEYLYFRFELNKNSPKIKHQLIENQIVIYFSNEKSRYYSPIRFVNKDENFYPIIKKHFSNELRFVFDEKNISRIFLNKAISYGLWYQNTAKKSKIAYKDVIELKIALEDLAFETKEFSFCVIDASNELINEVYPQDSMINIKIED